MLVLNFKSMAKVPRSRLALCAKFRRCCKLTTGAQNFSGALLRFRQKLETSARPVTPRPKPHRSVDRTRTVPSGGCTLCEARIHGAVRTPPAPLTKATRSAEC